MAETMILIPGRSTEQGTTMLAGKLKPEYIKVTNTVEMNEDDMARLKLKDGDEVRLSTGNAAIVVRCKGRTAEDLPSGLLFIPYGPPTSRLMGTDTACTGMPLSKHLEVEVTPK